MNVQDISALAESRLSTGPLRNFRAENLGLLQKEGLSFKGEAYKYTNVHRFFEELGTETGLHSVPETVDDAFVFVDGKLVAAPSIEGLKSRSFTEEDLKTLNQSTPLSPLHHSLMGEGLVIELEKNVELKKPVKVVHILGLDNVSAPTVLVKLGRFSKMTLLEETKSSMKNYALVSETYAECATGSKLEHVQIDENAETAIGHGSTWAQVAQDASYSNFIFHLNGKLLRRNLDIRLTEAGANGETYSLYLTAGQEHSDIHTVINHLSPDTTSNQIAKGILAGDSKGVFTGKIHIHPKAQRVASGQLNKNLLLSKKAQVHSQPQLEIFADDVKCSHGSTTGQMSEEELFYFEARGIPREKARTLLAFGFGLDVVMKLQNDEVKKIVESRVMGVLREKFDLGGSR